MASVSHGLVDTPSGGAEGDVGMATSYKQQEYRGQEEGGGKVGSILKK